MKYQNIFDTKHLQSDLKLRSLHSGAITISSQGILLLIQIGSTMILARILSPEDYGMMEMVVAFTGLAGIFCNLGLSTATIQWADINHAQVSSLFWINAGLGGIVMLIIAGLSPVIAWFYDSPGLLWVMVSLSSIFFINGLAVQHQALLNRQMRFFALATIQVVSMLIGISFAIIAAKHEFGYWALVLNNITIAICSTVGAWLTLRWVPSLPRRNTSVISMIRFGSDLVGFNVINYFARNLDNILIGRYCGSTALGFYSKAYQLLMMPITNLRDPLTGVAMPALSRLQNDPEKYREYYMKFISILSFISMPVVVFMTACSEQIIGLILGPQWIDTSAIFKILAIAAFIQPIAGTGGMVLLSRGKSKMYLVMGIISAVIFCISFVVGLPWGPQGVATAYVVANYLLLCPTLYFVFKGTKIRMSDIWFSIYKPLFASLLMGGMVGLLLSWMNNISVIATLIISFFSSAVLYIVVFLIFSGGMDAIRDYCTYGKLIFKRKT